MYDSTYVCMIGCTAEVNTGYTYSLRRDKTTVNVPHSRDVVARARSGIINARAAYVLILMLFLFVSFFSPGFLSLCRSCPVSLVEMFVSFLESKFVGGFFLEF